MLAELTPVGRARNQRFERSRQAATWRFVTSIRLPRAMFASARWRPQAASGTREDGRSAERRDLQDVGVVGRLALGRVGVLDLDEGGVDRLGGLGEPRARPVPIVLPGAKGSLGSTTSRLAAPVRSAAGLLQRTSKRAGSEGRKTAEPGRPKRASAGTGALKVEKAIAQRSAACPCSPGCCGSRRRRGRPPRPSRCRRAGSPRRCACGRPCARRFVCDQLPQHVGALRVADQDHSAAVVVVAQVGLPGVDDVAVGEVALLGADRLAREDALERDLPVQRGVDTAVPA